MSRDIFPYPEDRTLITSFLLGHVGPMLTTDMLATGGTGHGYLAVLDDDAAHVTVAWFDTGGALVFSLNDGRSFGTVALTLNEICHQLGTEVRVTREARESTQFEKVVRAMHYFIGDEAIAPGTPRVVMDGLAIKAWRAHHLTTVGDTPA